ncbi:LamG domain-containing protein [Roseburia hominis]
MNYTYQYVVLSMDGEKTVEGGSEIGIKMDGSVPFTIDGWIRTSESFVKKQIISKKGVFSMGVDGEKLFLHIEGYPSVMASASKGTVVAGEWTHVCAVYSNSAVFLYINGVSNIYASIDGSGQDNSEPFLFGEGLCGLVRQVRIFNCALDSDQVNRYMMVTDLSNQDFKDKLAAYFDFSQVPAAERIGGLPVIIPEASMQQAVSQGALFHGNSYLTIDRENNINPAGGGNDSYTVQGWVFLEPDREEGRYTVFANGDVNDWAGMSLYIEEEDGKYYAKAARASGTGEDTILSSVSEIAERQWVNIAVTYSVDTMKLYVNGELDATLTGLYPIHILLPIPHLRIGAEVVENNPSGQNWFSGCISRLDIWERGVSAEEIKQYAEKTPETEVEGLLASYSFHLLDGGNACTCNIIGERNELRYGEVFAAVSNQQISDISEAVEAWEEPLTQEQLEQFRQEAFGGKNGEPAAFTVTSHRIGDTVYFVAHDRASSYTMCQADANDIDPLTQWYIELVLLVVGGVISILFGVSVRGSSSRLMEILLRFCQNPQLRTLFAEAITPATIFQVFKLLMSTGALVDVLRAILTGFGWWKVAWMVAKMCILAAASWAGSWVYYATAIGVLAAELLMHWKKYADIVCDIGLSSVRFHHMLQGDATVSLRINKRNIVPVPEWTSSNRNCSHAAYRIDAFSGGHGNVIVQASFQSTVNDAFSRDIRCIDKSKEKLFGNSNTVNVNMSGGSSVPYYVSFTFPNHKLASLGVGVSEVELCWQEKDRSGNWKDITETTHTIYRILHDPYAPWDSYAPLEKKEPWVKVLEYACTWAKGETTKEGVASKIVTTINKSLKLKYDDKDGKSFYTKVYINKGWYFLLTRFLSHLQGMPYSDVVNCTDCATICATFANAVGCSLSEKRMMDTKDDFGFECNKILAIGSTTWKIPFNTGFNYHEVCMMEPLQGKGSVIDNNAYKVYDACLMVDGSTNPDSDNGRISQLPLGMQFSLFPDGTLPSAIPSGESYREHLAKNSDDGVGRCLYDTDFNNERLFIYKQVE